MVHDGSAGSDANSEPDPLRRLGLTHIDGFRIEDQVGAGGMGVVYRAWDEAVGRPVAIKLLLAGAKADASQRKRFQRELQALGQLRHPGVLTVHRSGQVRGVPYVATEWLDGRSLGERVKQDGPLAPTEAAAVAVDLARAVAHAHQQGILHRDIKPDNVVLVPGRGPVLLDFGLAKTFDPEASRLTRSGTFAGTLAYASPEQLVDTSKVDERADVFSLGATLFCLLTGESPAERINNVLALAARAAEGRLPGPCDIDPECPRALDGIVRKAMRPEPDDRHPTAADLADALEEYLADPAPQGRSRIPLLAAGVLLPVVLVVASFGAGGGSEEATAPTPSPATTPRATPPAPGPARPQPAAEPGDPAFAARLAQVHTKLDALIVDVAQRGPVTQSSWARDVRALDRLLAAAILEARAGGPAVLGAALADAGRYPKALETLRGTSAHADPRRLLAWASTRIALAASRGEQPDAALPILRRITAGRARTDLDPRVVALARLWTAHVRQRSPAKAEVRRQIAGAIRLVPRGGSTPAWLAREVWIAVAGFLLRAPSPKARVELAPPLAQLDKAATTPWWSQAFTELWLRGWGAVRLPPPVFNRLELLVTHAPTRLRVRSLGQLAALVGRHGTLRRLDALGTGVVMGPLRARAEQIAAEESKAPRGAKIVISGRRAGLVLRPDQPKVRLLWEFPEGAWTLRLRGADVDLDLSVCHDEPPRRGDPFTREARSMARDEQVSCDVERPTSGLHQVVVARSNPWPEPLAVDLELVPRDPAWTSPWEVTGSGVYPPGTLKAMAESRRLNQQGRVEEALAKLRPFEPRVPSILLVRASMLSDAGAWGRLRRLQARAAPADPKVRRALAYEAARVALLDGEAQAAGRLLEGVLAKDPHVLAAREELALAQVGDGRLLSAFATLRRIARRDPHQEHARALMTVVRALAEKGDPGPKIAPVRQKVARSARSRELVVRALLLAKRPKLALELLEGETRPREAMWRLEAMIALGRTGPARALVRQLQATPLAPFRKRRLERLRARIKAQ